MLQFPHSFRSPTGRPSRPLSLLTRGRGNLPPCGHNSLRSSTSSRLPQRYSCYLPSQLMLWSDFSGLDMDMPDACSRSQPHFAMQGPQEVNWDQFKDVEPLVLDGFKKAMAGAQPIIAHHLRYHLRDFTMLAMDVGTSTCFWCYLCCTPRHAQYEDQI